MKHPKHIITEVINLFSDEKAIRELSRHEGLAYCEEVRKLFYSVMDKYEGWLNSRRTLIRYWGTVEQALDVWNRREATHTVINNLYLPTAEGYLKTVYAFFERKRVPTMAVFGTALGIAREDGLIMGDTDIDLAIDKYHYEEVLSLLGDLRTETSLRLVDSYDEDVLTLQSRSGIQVDLYFFSSNEERRVCSGYSISHAQWDEAKVVHTTNERIGAIRMPGRLHDYLIDKYGEDYMTPIANKHATT